jgi:SSS family transporter
MNWFTEHSLHLVLIAIYLVIIARHAIAGRQHVTTLGDYLVAGRRMGGLVIALSFYATFMSTNTFIGAAGKSWDVGLSWCLGGVVLTALAGISWFVVAPRFVPLTRQYDSLTVADFLGSHYASSPVRKLAAGIVAFASVLYLIAIYRGASLALASFLDLPYVGCVLVIGVIVTLYTLMGGFESVVLTDALQGALMLVGAVAILTMLLYVGGGLNTMLASLAEQDKRLVSWTDADGLSLTLAYSLSVGVKYLVEPRQLSRFYGLRDASALRLAACVAPLAILISYTCLLPVGAFARTIISLDAVGESGTDQIVPYLLGEANLLGDFTSTLFLLVLVSAAMSSIDSVLLVAASTIDRDLLGTSELHSQRQDLDAVTRTRWFVVLVSVVAAGSALIPQMRDIVEMTAFSGSMYGACFLPVLVFGLFVKRRSAAAACTTIVLGALTVTVAFALKKLGWSTIHEVYPGILVGTAVYFALTLRGQ